jgi:hypothetical protein
MSKVRYVDWSPDEWIAGVDGVLTAHEAAIYQRALMTIYSRGGECPNDAEFLATRFKINTHHRAKAWHVRRAREALDRLIELGKLRPSPDGQWLTNGRADRVLNQTRERISGNVRAGIASGAARRARSTRGAPMTPHSSPDDAQVTRPRLREINDLDRTTVRNHQPSTIKESDREISTDAAREPAPDQTAPARAPAKPDPRLEALAAKARAKLMKGES